MRLQYVGGHCIGGCIRLQQGITEKHSLSMQPDGATILSGIHKARMNIINVNLQFIQKVTLKMLAIYIYCPVIKDEIFCGALVHTLHIFIP